MNKYKGLYYSDSKMMELLKTKLEETYPKAKVIYTEDSKVAWTNPTNNDTLMLVCSPIMHAEIDNDIERVESLNVIEKCELVYDMIVKDFDGYNIDYLYINNYEYRYNKEINKYIATCNGFVIFENDGLYKIENERKEVPINE